MYCISNDGKAIVLNYFGKFNASVMKQTLQCIEIRIVKWAMCKYKNFRGRRRRAVFIRIVENKSCMKGDFHVQLCEKFEVEFRLLTRLREWRSSTAFYPVTVLQILYYSLLYMSRHMSLLRHKLSDVLLS